MRRHDDDTAPHALVGRAGLVFAYVCMIVALALFGGALYFLPMTWQATLFLGVGVALLVSMFAFMALATHLVLRKDPVTRRKDKPTSEVDSAALEDAKGSLRPR